MAQIIRKLGIRENLKFAAEVGRLFTRTVRVTSKVDLYSRPAVLNTAIRNWMSTHPFLRARVAMLGSSNYFVYDERYLELNGARWTSDSSRLANVKYLKFDSGKLKNNVDERSFMEDISLLLAERELSDDFNYYHQLLWRLVFFEISDERKKGVFEYNITMAVHHSISEGRNSMMLLLQLLDLIEASWRDLKPPLKVYHALPGIEELYYDHFDSSKRVVKPTPRTRLPSYIDGAFAKSTRFSKPFTWINRVDLSDRIDSLEMPSESKTWLKQPGIQLDQLIETSRELSFKTRRLKLSRQVTSKLIEKCRVEKCTVNCTLEALLVFSLKKLLDSIGPSPLAVQAELIGANTMTMRQFESTLQNQSLDAAFTNFLTMGCYIASEFVVHENLDDLEPENKEAFWKIARNNTRHLHTLIRNREIFTPTELQVLPRSECHSSFGISNMGVLPSRLPDEFSLSPRDFFQLQETYAEMNYSNWDHYSLYSLMLLASTCDERLNLSFQYNSRVVSHLYVDRAVGFFFEFLNRMIN